MSNRIQVVKVDKTLSDESSCTYGVPQGSTLGPTLFLMYINALCKMNLKGADLIMFADDTVLVFHDKTWDGIMKLAERGLCEVSSWLENNLLSLNTVKTKFVCFYKTATTSPPSNLILKVHMHPCNKLVDHDNRHCNYDALVRVENIKYLGVTINEKLTWQQHLTITAKRIRSLIYIFKNLRTIADNNLLIQTYRALCQCIIVYCISSWGGAPKTYMIEVERAQRALLKIMMYLPFKYPTNLLHNQLGVLSVRKLYILQCIQRYHRFTVPTLNLPERRITRYPVPNFITSLVRRQYDYNAPCLYTKLDLKL